MTPSDIEAMQIRIHAAGFPLAADGLWGPKSRAACQAYLRSLMPSPHPWPRQDESSLASYYGDAGDEDYLVRLPVAGLGVAYDGKAVSDLAHSVGAYVFADIIQAVGAVPVDVKALYETILHWLDRGGACAGHDLDVARPPDDAHI